jgi:DNA-binding beta-propeller fold protein YncE
MNARTALRVLALILPLAARAEPLAFSYTASIYQDAKEVALRSPEGVACTGGSLVVADTGNRRLLTFALKESGIIAQTGEVKLGQLPSPVRIQVDGKGNLLVLDGKSHKIVRVDANGGFGGFVELKGAPAAPMILGFKLDSADNVYALDVASGKVLVADSTGTVTRAVDLPKGLVISDVAVDGGGTIYALDGVGATVWSAAKGATAFTQLGKSLKDRMSFPSYVVAHQGKLILVDQHGMGLVVLGLDGSYLGRQLAIGWSDGFVYYPSQLCINEKGESFIADRGNNRVQQFSTGR